MQVKHLLWQYHLCHPTVVTQTSVKQQGVAVLWSKYNMDLMPNSTSTKCLLLLNRGLGTPGQIQHQSNHPLQQGQPNSRGRSCSSCTWLRHTALSQQFMWLAHTSCGLYRPAEGSHTRGPHALDEWNAHLQPPPCPSLTQVMASKVLDQWWPSFL